MTTWQAMARLEALGYCLGLTEDGRAKARVIGEAPAEAEALLKIARQDPGAAADYVRMRQAGLTVVDEGRKMSLLDALSVGQAVRKGEAELLGKVRLHPDDLTVSLCWIPVNGEQPEMVLHRWRKKTRALIEKRLQEMDASSWWELNAEEYNHFCARYGFYKRLLDEKEEAHGLNALAKA